MSDYEKGAFEALEWTWHILRKYDEKSYGIKEAKDTITETLFMLGNGESIKFKEKILESITNNETNTPIIEVYDG